jgi:hypothetical protein
MPRIKRRETSPEGLLAQEETSAMKLDEGTNTFPAVTSVNAIREAHSVTLIFSTRVAGETAAFEFKLSPGQWEALKALVDRREA